MEEQNNAAPGARRRPPSDDPFTVLSRNTNLGKALESSRLRGPACGARQTRKRGKDSKRRRTPAPRAPQSTISRWTVYCSGAVLGPSRATFRAWHGAPTPSFSEMPLEHKQKVRVRMGRGNVTAEVNKASHPASGQRDSTGGKAGSVTGVPSATIARWKFPAYGAVLLILANQPKVPSRSPLSLVCWLHQGRGLAHSGNGSITSSARPKLPGSSTREIANPPPNYLRITPSPRRQRAWPGMPDPCSSSGSFLSRFAALF